MSGQASLEAQRVVRLVGGWEMALARCWPKLHTQPSDGLLRHANWWIVAPSTHQSAASTHAGQQSACIHHTSRDLPVEGRCLPLLFLHPARASMQAGRLNHPKRARARLPPPSRIVQTPEISSGQARSRPPWQHFATTMIYSARPHRPTWPLAFIAAVVGVLHLIYI